VVELARDYNPDLDVRVLLTRVDPRTKDAAEMLEFLAEQKLTVLPTKVCERVAFRRAIGEGASVQELGRDQAAIARWKPSSRRCGMSMKANRTSGFASQRKDLNAFLESGAADAPKSLLRHLRPTPPAATPPVVEETPRYGRARVQKIFNFPEELADRLRAKRSSAPSRRADAVTEKDIVIEALEAFLKR
jgi:hypothetical protein